MPRITLRLIRPARGLLPLLGVAILGAGLVSVRSETADAVVPPVPPGWSTMFSDDFSGPVNTPPGSNWLYDLGTSYPGGAPNWGTGEVETATNSLTNVYLDGNGHLVIKALRDSSGHWTSGRLETRRVDFAAPPGGEVAMSASLRQPNPRSGNGYWPAFWALGAAARPVSATNWPGIGELDVMEDVNAGSQVSHTFHCGVWGQPPCNEPDGISSGLLPCAGCQTAYHTYTVVVDRTNSSAEQLRFYTDGVVQYTVHQNQVDASTWAKAVQHGFFLVLDLAIGGSYPNKACACNSLTTQPSSGADLSVDWVAVYQKPAATTSAPPTTAPPTTAPPTTAPPTTAPRPTPGRISAASTVQAESSAAQSGTRTATALDTGGGAYVGWIGNGDWLRYDRLDFGSKPLTQFLCRVASGAAAGISGLVEVHLDSLTGPIAGSFAIAETGGWQTWRTVPANLNPTTGVHTVFLKFVSGAPQDFVNVNWLTFS